MKQAQAGLERLYTCLENLEFFRQNAPEGTAGTRITELLAAYKKRFCDAMDDDLNTALAISALFDMVRDINSEITAVSGHSKADIDACIGMLKELGGVLGLLQRPRQQALDADIEALIARRQAARKRKEFCISRRN